MHICRDCEEGKHGACIGSTFIEANGADIYEVACDCEDDYHTWEY